MMNRKSLGMKLYRLGLVLLTKVLVAIAADLRKPICNSKFALPWRTKRSLGRVFRLATSTMSRLIELATTRLGQHGRIPAHIFSELYRTGIAGCVKNFCAISLSADLQCEASLQVMRGSKGKHSGPEPHPL